MSLIAQYQQFKVEQSAKIQELSKKIMEIHEESHWDLIENMKGCLGSDAINDIFDEEAQENTLSETEDWVSNNCSGGGIEEDVAMALWLRGPSLGEAFLDFHQKAFYVWADGDCQNKTHSRQEALNICEQFREAGRYSSVLDEDDNEVSVQRSAAREQAQAG